MREEDKQPIDPKQAKEKDEHLSQVDVDEVAAERISDSISEGYINGDLEGF
jgi:hypothetical protein